MASITFVRRVDGLTYLFLPDGEADGFPSYRRADLDLWCRRLPDFGWVVCDADGSVSSRPFSDPGLGNVPPQGMWVSGKADRAYVYDLVFAV